MSLARNRYEAERLDQLSRTLRRAQENLGNPSRDTALLALRLAKQELEQVILLLDTP